MARLEATTAVLLAAGLSRRYGAVGKLVADFRGRPLALHAADMLASLPLDRRIAVCRSGDEDLAELLLERGFEVVLNPDTARGLSSSLALGVAAAGEPDAILICLADMPLVTAAHVRKLVAASRDGNIVASAEAGRAVPTPPAVFTAAHIPALLALEGDKGARGLLQDAEIILAPTGTLADVDTPDDFRR